MFAHQLGDVIIIRLHYAHGFVSGAITPLWQAGGARRLLAAPGHIDRSWAAVHYRRCTMRRTSSCRSICFSASINAACVLRSVSHRRRSKCPANSPPPQAHSGAALRLGDYLADTSASGPPLSSLETYEISFSVCLFSRYLHSEGITRQHKLTIWGLSGTQTLGELCVYLSPLYVMSWKLQDSWISCRIDKISVYLTRCLIYLGGCNGHALLLHHKCSDYRLSWQTFMWMIRLWCWVLLKCFLAMILKI